MREREGQGATCVLLAAAHSLVGAFAIKDPLKAEVSAYSSPTRIHSESLSEATFCNLMCIGASEASKDGALLHYIGSTWWQSCSCCAQVFRCAVRLSCSVSE